MLRGLQVDVLTTAARRGAGKKESLLTLEGKGKGFAQGWVSVTAEEFPTAYHSLADTRLGSCRCPHRGGLLEPAASPAAATNDPVPGDKSAPGCKLTAAVVGRLAARMSGCCRNELAAHRNVEVAIAAVAAERRAVDRFAEKSAPVPAASAAWVPVPVVPAAWATAPGVAQYLDDERRRNVVAQVACGWLAGSAGMIHGRWWPLAAVQQTAHSSRLNY